MIPGAACNGIIGTAGRVELPSANGVEVSRGQIDRAAQDRSTVTADGIPVATRNSGVVAVVSYDIRLISDSGAAAANCYSRQAGLGVIAAEAANEIGCVAGRLQTQNTRIVDAQLQRLIVQRTEEIRATRSAVSTQAPREASTG